MISDKQIEANRKNSKRGGVKTEKGKSVSRYNAVKHGILNGFMSKQESDLADKMYSQLVKEYNATTTIERMIIERMTCWYVRLHRVMSADNVFLVDIFVKQNPNESEPIKLKVPGLFPSHFEELCKTLLRYETTMENGFYKSLHELQRTKALQNGYKSATPVAIDIREQE